jgi:murein L,D-transpeptidase YafK
MNRIFAFALLLCLSTPAQALQNVNATQLAARILVTKSDRNMYLFDKDGNLIKTYQISLGKSPVGTKRQEGDNKTPEGKYFIESRNQNSDYYLSLRISYPSPADAQRARRQGVSPGGDIFIHGMPNGKEWMHWKYSKKKDWTNGCIAVNNAEIQELWSLVPDKTPILILP